MRHVTLRRLILLFAAMLFASRADAQTHHGIQLVRADLLADTTTVAPGKPFMVGLRLKMAPHWHTYWQYSGDAGLPTKIAWTLPAGFKAGPIQWPVPEKIVSPGDIINYGYGEEVMLLSEITPPATLPPGEAELKAKADWLVCADVCVPGSAELSLKLPAGSDAPQPANADLFKKYGDRLPRALDASAGFTVVRAVEGNELVLRLPGLKATDGQTVEFFPLPPDDVEIGHPAVDADGSLDGDKWFKVRVPMQGGTAGAPKVGGVVALSGGGVTTGWTLPAADQPVAAAAPVQPSLASPIPRSTAENVAAAPAGSLWHFLLFGFLGGLILNVMPCVLPVISLKIFSFVRQANEDPARVLRLGLAYAAGVFAWFLGFAVLVIVARHAGGQQVGYSFQLQNPWFLLALIAVTFVFSLNLLGVFEVILPGSISNAAGEAASGEGYSGAFLQGVLATVLGSACTAPFFFDALGFAFSQNALVILVMFAAIASGMSAPFIILSAFPQWLRFLPKPGAWMERVKQGTGFLMLATVLWLLWNFGENRQSTDAVAWTGALLLVLSAACWVQGSFNTLVASAGSRWAARAAIAVLILGGGAFCVSQIVQAEPILAGNQTPFARQLDEAQKTGRLVFVDFTASWCVNCKVNERVVLATGPIQKALQDHNAVFLKADYSRYSKDIADILHRFNAPSVPLYVIYPAGKPSEPVVLPVTLTQRIVLDGLAEADHRAGSAVATR